MRLAAARPARAGGCGAGRGLHGAVPHAPARADVEEVLAGGEAVVVAQRLQRRQPHQGQRRCLPQRDGARRVGDLVRGHDHVLRRTGRGGMRAGGGSAGVGMR
jgi:hypothetical protein